ncbi:MAG: colanic acid biosynthesis glycosyltransferase WcaL [Verrucomicrobia bacterium CG_4_10_14_3_um_filter_43_23]|nr:MAG: hypothetical protein AUJ82_04290 [Verrucomicrobia bacterium CG1_02_43_26]PIP59081.1 MAG: colanic acid biosynthesis glycosyltransferase WcaL [Verrucomicrobia bacterium CG22_combo_CG10-13_8_21_14_all_43_17]PIX58218.1 MAG: colanic acid biosynthesis glycosyltransferase WcaL [Verrucomicrobia bacterium CG_4_10_14_3_um_filter_43_23]PIY61297.1 MAG: colanic acid biosynthesis glycosyltransferase WcaL [Verrucomicrobia bacterium CG_4_10_14_0_8_um_filter_43_34]
MKLVYLVSEYPAISHTFIFREIKVLRSRGVEILTFSINRPNHLEKMTSEEQEESTKTFYVKSAPLLSVLSAFCFGFFCMPLRFIKMGLSALRLNFKGVCSGRKTLGYFIEALILVNETRKRGINHVHVHFANPAATVAMLAATSGKVKFSLSVHGPDVFDNVRENILAEKVLQAVFVRCISNFCKSQLMRLVDYPVWGKLHVIPCGIDPEKFVPQKKKSAPGVFEILCLGRLSPAKGQHILLKAFGLLLEEYKNIHLSLVGGGATENSLKTLAKELTLGRHIDFVGPVGQEKLNEYYDKADIFVLPSFAEGVPVVLMEAMAKEIPVVSSSVMGIPELVEDGKTGLLTLPADPHALFEKIKELLNGPDLRERMGQAARRKVLSNYDLAKNTESLLNIFNHYIS